MRAAAPCWTNDRWRVCVRAPRWRSAGAAFQRADSPGDRFAGVRDRQRPNPFDDIGTGGQRGWAEQPGDHLVGDGSGPLRRDERQHPVSGFTSLCCIGFGSRVGQHQGANVMRCAAHQREREISSHGQTADHRLFDSHGVEKIDEIRHVIVDGTRRGIVFAAVHPSHVRRDDVPALAGKHQL